MERKTEAGATYLMVLFLVATLSILLAATGSVWSFTRQRENERILLLIGNQFRRAITSYHDRSPGTVKQFPESLNVLLDDRRFLGTMRHLRRIYSDPLTGKPEWGLVYAPEGGIMGVYSLAEGGPIRESGFRERDAGFAGAGRYEDWKFTYNRMHPGN